MYCARCGKRLADYKTYCDKCGTAFEVSISNSYIEHLTPLQRAELKFPMAWFKFLIYFNLFIGTILSVGSGARMIAGTNFPSFIYEDLPELRILDVCTGLLMLGLGIFQVIIRFRLANFKKDAPIIFLLNYILESAVNVLYILVFLLICRDMEFLVSNMIYTGICGVIMNAIILVCNYFYFKRRKELFVN